MIIVFDTETTGLPKHPKVHVDQQPRIIEFGCAVLDSSGKRLREFNTLVNPKMQIGPEITKITGITNEQLATAPTFGEVWPEIAPHFEGVKYAIAHNLPFDRSMLAFEFMRFALARGELLTVDEAIDSFDHWPEEGEICSAGMFQSHWGRRPRLVELYEWSLGKPLAQTHRALDDVNALCEVLTHEGVFGDLIF